MAIKRLHEGFGVGEDSCVSGIHPMREEDLRRGQQGLYLGVNPESPSKGLFITYFEAEEIAGKIGYPLRVVYDEQKKLIDEQAAEIAELEHRLNVEVHSLQLKAVTTEIKNIKRDVLHEIEGLSVAIRARLGGGGSNVAATPGANGDDGAAKAL